MARTGMSNPIIKLRSLTEAGSADYTVNAVTYWTDDQLQTVLDTYRTDVFSETLEPVITYDGSGTANYYDYFCIPGDYEEGTAQFRVTTSLGSAVTPTINYQAGHLSFGAVNQAGTAYYLTARRFDISAAAADVWRRKAAHVAEAYDFSADGQSMSRSQMKKHFSEMAQMYSGQAQPSTARLTRDDVN